MTQHIPTSLGRSGQLRRCRSHQRAALTLIEMVLTLALLTMAMGLVVVSATHWLDREKEDDIAWRLEALMAQLRAESALSGQRVRLYLPAIAETQAMVMLHRPDAEEGDSWVELTEGPAMELLDLQQLRFLQVSRLEDKSWDSAMDQIAGDNEDWFPAITFYPDGSQDSVEVDWVYRPNPVRVGRLRMDGMSGRTDQSLLTTALYEEETGITVTAEELDP